MSTSAAHSSRGTPSSRAGNPVPVSDRPHVHPPVEPTPDSRSLCLSIPDRVVSPTLHLYLLMKLLTLPSSIFQLPFPDLVFPRPLL